MILITDYLVFTADSPFSNSLISLVSSTFLHPAKHKTDVNSNSPEANLFFRMEKPPCFSHITL